MIKTENGVVEFKGTEADVLSDMGCIVAAITQALYKCGYTKEQIRDKFANVVSISFSHGIREVTNKGGEEVAHYIVEFILHFIICVCFYAWGHHSGQKLEEMCLAERYEILYQKSQAFDKIQAVPRNEWQEYYMDDVIEILEEFEKEGE